ncbi:hypothetical protein BSLG_010648 [Batrachochytrium salamandrivorans]|nr:hypothetical protein BSLG_010648 [Batrachochytrium salamandrivorans]
MQVSENQPPGQNPTKAKYMLKDIVRNAKLYDVPITAMPGAFPDNSLKAQRLLTAVKTKQPDKLVASSRAIWQCYWRDGLSLNSNENLIKYLSPVLGESAQSYVSQDTNDTGIKQMLKEATQAAIGAGAFGAPWIVVERTINGKLVRDNFFGSDRIEQIALLLGKPYYGPVPAQNMRHRTANL